MGDTYHTLSKPYLLDLVKQAFEAGCCSYLDLRDDACLELLEDFLKKVEEKTKSPEKPDGTHQARVTPWIRSENTILGTGGAVAAPRTNPGTIPTATASGAWVTAVGSYVTANWPVDQELPTIRQSTGGHRIELTDQAAPRAEPAQQMLFDTVGTNS